MSTTPDTIYAKQFGNVVYMLSQQKGSRLRGAVTIEPNVTGEEVYMDQVGAEKAQIRGARLEETNPSLAKYYRRRIALEDVYIAKAIDHIDKIRTLADPTSAIVKSVYAGIGRQIDDIIISAALGTAYTGKSGGTAKSLPSSQKIAAGGTDLTLDKLLKAKKLFNKNEVDDEDLFLVIGSEQEEALMNVNEVKSFDYNTQRVLVNGKLDSFLGFKIIRSERLSVSSSIRSCFAFARTGIGLAIANEPISKISELPTQHYVKQIYYSIGVGASRLEEEKVVQIDCDESA